MRPKLGFLGVGWIGRNRLQAIDEANVADLVAVADADQRAAEAAASEVGAAVVEPDAVFDSTPPLDGLVIATPSALHAAQAIRALERGLSVFCQKPLGRTADECASVVDAARQADRLLRVDLSYRCVAGVDRMREIVAGGEIGDVYAGALVFHNAYGPDKAWFTDPVRSGGGCVIDLGIHVMDLALWLLGGPKVERVDARLFAGGRLLPAEPTVCEDHAMARLDLSTGATLDLSCSWFLHAGRDAVIELTLYGTEGALSLRNVDGSFYDFQVELLRGTSCEVLAAPPDAWGGRAAVAWVSRLAEDPSFDPAASELVDVAAVLDAIYGR